MMVETIDPLRLKLYEALNAAYVGDPPVYDKYRFVRTKLMLIRLLRVYQIPVNHNNVYNMSPEDAVCIVDKIKKEHPTQKLVRLVIKMCSHGDSLFFPHDFGEVRLNEVFCIAMVEDLKVTKEKTAT